MKDGTRTGCSTRISCSERIVPSGSETRMTDFLRSIDEFLATFTPEEQAVTRVVFRSLVEGRGIRPEAVAVALEASLTTVERAVDQPIERGTMR